MREKYNQKKKKKKIEMIDVMCKEFESVLLEIYVT